MELAIFVLQGSICVLQGFPVEDMKEFPFHFTAEIDA
jgi:hypothetical protein